MKRVYTNGPEKDFVLNPFQNFIRNSTRIYAAAPYFTKAEALVEGATAGKSIDLLVGLNEATSREALQMVHGLQNIAVRYLTRRFHAKIFIFDSCALVGSSNLSLLQNSSNAANFDCVRGAERPALRPARA